MRQKYIHHYRQLLPWVLEHLTFRSENRFQPVIEALAAIKRSLDTKGTYFAEDVPLDGVVLPSWQDTVLESKDGKVRINRQYYELCVLQQLERALKCKEIWVEGAYAFRNPSHDMPTGWQDDAQRLAYYGLLPQPVTVTSFTDRATRTAHRRPDPVQSRATAEPLCPSLNARSERGSPALCGGAPHRSTGAAESGTTQRPYWAALWDVGLVGYLCGS